MWLGYLEFKNSKIYLNKKLMKPKINYINYIGNPRLY